MYVCLGYDMTFGNLSASRGWLAKAARVVEDSGLDVLQGWVLLCEAVTLHHQDLVAAAEKARKALDAARETNNVDLDVCARSELGAALVELGRTSEGTALLDEAMAGAHSGEVETLDTVVLASCREALARLGYLRVTQRRTGEAERLTSGYEQHAAVVPVLGTARPERTRQPHDSGARDSRAARGRSVQPRDRCGCS